MTNTALKAQIDTDITTATGAGSVTTGDVGNNMKAIVDYVDQEVKKSTAIFKVSQSGNSDPTLETILNKTGLTYTISRVGAGYYRLTPSATLTGNFRFRLDFQSDSFPVPTWEMNNSGIFIDIKTRYRQSSSSSPLADEVINGAYIEVEIFA